MSSSFRMRTEELYRIADRDNVRVFFGDFSECISLSVPGNVGMDYSLIWDEKQEREKLAHELGHCERNAFYRKGASASDIQREENRADKWAIKKLVPEDELKEAVQKGYTDVWELAEYFDVPEGFMRKAICLYEHGNLAVSQYFPG